MRVKLLSSTQNLLDNIYLSASTCYSSISPIERYEKIDSIDCNKKIELVSNCIKSGHESVIEHSLFTFAIEGVSRAFLAQISRHRLLSLSVKSQRYVQIKEDQKYLGDLFDKCYSSKDFLKSELAQILNKYFVDGDEFKNVNGYYFALDNYLEAINSGEKAEDARRFLPNATKTDMVLSLNLRELRHLASLRMCSHSQLEIRKVVTEMVKQVVELEPWLKPFLGPKCETVLGYCNEMRNPCGRKPSLQELLGNRGTLND